MKKLFLLFAVAIFALIPVSAKDKISRNVADLPAAAQTMLKKYFSGEDVSHIKIDKHFFGGVDYDVILENGTEIEFDEAGTWKEIDCGRRAVPNDLIHKPIRDYIKNNFKNQKIVKIEIKSNKYNIELINGVDLEFDRAGNFLRIDD